MPQKNSNGQASSPKDFMTFLDDFASRRAKGQKLEFADVLRMLDVAPESHEGDILRARAREKARSAANNRGKIWSAVGIEHRPCAMNCQFCSFGEKWGLVKEEYDWSEADIIAAAQKSVAGGASWFVLRTNEIYDVGRLRALAEKIRGAVPGDYKLVVNTGELTADQGARLKTSGVNGVYHTWRLGEGKTTAFNPETRLATMRSITRAGLELYFMVEPLGPEHANEEIAARILAADECLSSLGGVMARINVPGTPLAKLGHASQKRISHIVAVCRLCAGGQAIDICAVPPARENLEAGANVLTVEVGAIPRSRQTEHKDAWRGFGMEEAKDLLRSAGYQVESGEQNAG